MFDIRSTDYGFITVNKVTGVSPYDSKSTLNIDIGMTYQFKQEWDEMRMMLNEWQQHKRIIQNNPAVKASYEAFLTMVELAKEPA